MSSSAFYFGNRNLYPNIFFDYNVVATAANLAAILV